MADYVLSNKADADLDGIYVHSFETFGEARADAYFLSLRDCLQTMADNPRMGRPASFLHAGLLCHRHGRHVIYYLIEDTGIFVVRILHDAMDAPRHLGSGGVVGGFGIEAHPHWWQIQVMSKANTPISLGTTKVDITVSDRLIRTTASVSQRFLPRPRLIFECRAGTLFNDLDLGGVVSVRLPDYGTHLNALLIGCPLNENDYTHRCIFTPTSGPCTILRKTDQRLAFVRLGIINFPKFTGTLGGDLILKVGDWSVQIAKSPDFEENRNILERDGGYAITHTGVVSRTDQETFSMEDAEHLLEGLRIFLSFARGASCCPILPVGINREGEEVWKQWGAGKVEAWGWHHSWFDTRHGQMLSQVFPGFWAIYDDAKHSTAIRIAIAWYLRANRNDGDMAGGTILAQAALERLADDYSFNKEKTAADNIRLLLSEFNIPTAIPDCLPVLKELSGYFCSKSSEKYIKNHRDKLCDGPYIITQVRNEMIHPKEKIANMPSDAEFEAWNLGLWYVEMILLKIFGFNGSYANRLIEGRRVGTVEPVPWAAATPPPPG